MAAYRAVFTLTAAALTLGLFTAATTVDSNTDDVSCWCDSGIKLEAVDTPFTVPEPPDGARWSLLVIKAGSVQSTETVNYLAGAPTVAAAYGHPSGEEISHVILCEEPEPPATTSTTTTTPTTTTTSTTTTTTSTSTTTTTIAAPAPASPSTTAAPTTTTAAPTTSEPALTTTTPPPPDTTPSTAAVREEREQLPVTGPGDFLPIAVVVAVGMLTLGGAALSGTRRHRRNTASR